MALQESTYVSQRRKTLKRLLIERRYLYEESSSFLRLDLRCGCRPGFSCLLHHSRDLSPAHHDASDGFASNACCGLFPPGHHWCCCGPREPSEINEQVVACATRGISRSGVTM